MMPGDVVADRYEVEQVVGSGGMSTVYRAHDRVLERDIALKVLHERLNHQQDVVDRFGREAKLVAGLSHNNIVSVIDRGEHAGRPFIVFEFIAGENLKQLVTREGPLPVERALELSIEIARGLAFAHQKGFVHRDVKPQNVLLNGKGEAKVTDFGIARPLESQGGGETATGTVLGTCDYISPEQAQGARVDEQTDVYSLGIVVYELLTGEVPFQGDNFVAVAMQHINAPPPPISLKRPEVPRRLEQAVDRALAKHPEDRFPSMNAFCAELEASLAEVRANEDTGMTGVLPVVKPQRGRRAPRAPRRRRSRKPLVALVFLGLAIGAAALVLVLTRGGGSGGNGGGGGGNPVAIHVAAVAAYDPDGDHRENSGSIGYATDGNTGTAWDTEHYRYGGGSLGSKPGVGIIFDAGASVKARALKVVSTTPGYTAIVRAADTKYGPFSDDSGSQTGGSTTTFGLNGVRARYYLLWITNLGPSNQTAIAEVTATSSG
ncbi:MAG TPA: protein kinase [Gaiellaceae bacterium]|jgi:serine/threonine-protein kinase